MPTTSMAVPALSTKYGRERLRISDKSFQIVPFPLAAMVTTTLLI